MESMNVRKLECFFRFGKKKAFTRTDQKKKNTYQPTDPDFFLMLRQTNIFLMPYAAFRLACRIAALMMIFVLRKCHLSQRDDQVATGKQRLANRSITLPLCPPWQIAYNSTRERWRSVISQSGVAAERCKPWNGKPWSGDVAGKRWVAS